MARPVQGAVAGIGPAILVGVFALGRAVLDVGGNDAAAVLRDNIGRVFTRDGSPSDVEFETDGVVLKDQVNW